MSSYQPPDSAGCKDGNLASPAKDGNVLPAAATAAGRDVVKEINHIDISDCFLDANSIVQLAGCVVDGKYGLELEQQMENLNVSNFVLSSPAKVIHEATLGNDDSPLRPRK